jgi:hypothetical protein
MAGVGRAASRYLSLVQANKAGAADGTVRAAFAERPPDRQLVRGIGAVGRRALWQL